MPSGVDPAPGDPTDAEVDSDAPPEPEVPAITEVRFLPEQAFGGGVVTCDARYVSAGRTDLEVRYQWRPGAAEPSFHAGAAFTLDESTYAPGDQVWCSASLESPSATLDERTEPFTVGNRLPELSDVIITPEAGAPNDGTLSCEASASDPDGYATTLSYRWVHGTSGAVIGAGTSLTLDPGTVRPLDPVVCEVTATDTHGGESTATASVDVVNRPPVFDGVRVEPLIARIGDTLTCSAEASDPDGDAVSISFAWHDSATDAVLSPSATFDVTGAITPGTQIYCEATATDEHGAVTTGVRYRQVHREPPVVQQVDMLPAGPIYNDSEVSCEAVAIEPSGQDLTLDIAWANVTRELSLGEGAQITLRPRRVRPADVISCAVAAYVEEPSVATGQAERTVSNRPPGLDDVLIVTSPTVADAPLECLAFAFDPDEEPLSFSYTWRVNGALAGSDAAELPASAASPGDAVSCSVTVTDAAGESDTLAHEVILGDDDLTPPDVLPQPPGVDLTEDSGQLNLTDTSAWFDGQQDDSGLPEAIVGPSSASAYPFP